MKRWLKSLRKRAENQLVRNIYSLACPRETSLATPRLLDCGCSSGELTVGLAQKIKAREVHGIEIIEKMCNEAEERGIIVHRENLNTKFSLGDESIDVVHANQVIEHLYDTDNFVKEIHRVLIPNGYAIISTENLASWHNIFSLIRGYQPFSMANISSLRTSIGNPFGLTRGDREDLATTYKSCQHLRAFTDKGLKELFEAHSFKVETVLGAGYYPLPGGVSKLMCIIDPSHSAFLTLKARKVVMTTPVGK